MAPTADGGAVVGTNFSGSLTVGDDMYTSVGAEDVLVVRLAPDGAIQWAEQFGGAGNDALQDLAVDDAGSVVIAGNFDQAIDFGSTPLTSAGGSDVFLAKLSSQGTPTWARSFGDATAQLAWSVATTTSGSIALLGQFEGTLQFENLVSHQSAGQDDIFIAVFNSDGGHIWSNRFGDGGVNYLFAFGLGAGLDVVFDQSASVVLAGGFLGSLDFGGGPLTSTGGNPDLFVAKFTSGGQHIWSKRIGNSEAESLGSLSTTANGETLLAGSFSGTVTVESQDVSSAGGTDALIVSYGATGDLAFAHRLGDAADQRANGIAATAGGSYVAGTFDNAISSGDVSLSSIGASDAFLFRLDDAGTAIWGERLGDANADTSSGVAASASHLVWWGAFDGTIDIGADSYTSLGSSDMFVGALSR